MRTHPVTILLATVFAAACERDGPVSPLRPAGPLMEISDASRDAGKVHFYFLPPMAAQPDHAGSFDASVLPHVVVQVCELRADGCAEVARFTAEGKGLERVSTSEFFEHYLAIWRTDGPTVRVGVTYRAIVLAARTALGYADVKVVRTVREARSIDRTRYAVAVKGLPLPIRFRIETGAVFPIGPAGGSVTAAAGVVQLDFPAGAVSGVVGITVVPATDRPADAPAPIAGTAFAFGPDGSRFAQPVRLAIHYDPAAVANGVDQNSLRLHKLVGSEWVEVAGSSVDVATQTVRGEIGGFSEYGVLPARVDPGLVGDIAFVSEHWDPSNTYFVSDVFLMKEDRSNPINLTNDDSDHGDPVWSPTGDKLAFFTDGDIYVLGSTAAELRTIPDAGEDLAWSSAGPRGDLFFSKLGGIYTASSAGGTPQQLPLNVAPLVRDPWVDPYIRSDCKLSQDHPVPSPNGAQIAFVHSQECKYTHQDPSYPGAPFWRSLRSVAFANTAMGDVVGYARDWSDAFVPSQVVGPYAWSPKDATKIVVVAADINGEAREPLLVDVATHAVVGLLPEGEGFVEGLRGMAWSPIGDKLAFGATLVGQTNYEIWILDMSVSPYVLMNLTAHPGNDWSPTWSPDGTKIAFVTDRDVTDSVNDEIYVLKVAEPGVATRLTNNPGGDRAPRWRP
jgi:Tol biopolymer transport system component